MRKISYWASHHVWPSRILIVLLYIPLNVLGLITGDLLFDAGINLTGVFMMTCCLIVILAIFFYPSVNKSGITYFRSSNYFQRKTGDLVLLTCTACMICFTGNQLNSKNPFTLVTPAMGSPYTGAGAFTTEASVTSHLTHPGKSLVPKKQVRKKIVSFLKSFRKKYKDTSDGVKVLLILAAVLLIAITVLLILTLACSISCGGLEAISYVLLILGIGAGIFLTFLIFKRLSWRTPKERNRNPQPAVG